MTDNVKINVNGVEIQSEPNKLLIEACKIQEYIYQGFVIKD